MQSPPLLLVVSVLLLAPLTLAQPPVERSLYDRVQDLLALGVAQLPGPERWRELGPDAVDILFHVARDRESLAVHRQRAAAALSCFDESRSRGYLLELSTVAVDQGVRTAALEGLARLDPELALDPLRQALGDPDPHLRRRAAWVLGGVLLDRAGELLTAAREREGDPAVRQELERASRRHREGQARRHTDPLLVEVKEVTGSPVSPLPEGTVRSWRITVLSPLPVPVRLVARVQAVDWLLLPGGRGPWEHQLTPGESWELTLDTVQPSPDQVVGFGLLLQEAGRPASTRRIEVRGR